MEANNLPAIVTYIDFKKAFDTIHRGKMLKILQAYGIPRIIVDAIGSMYQNTKAKVTSPDGDTKLFDLLAGVLQGDTLAPYLFIIVLDYALRMAIEGKEEELGLHLVRRQSRRVGPVVVTDLDFADDIALLSNNIQQAQELLQRVETSVAKVGLKMNSSKTKYMTYNSDNTNINTNDGIALEEVNNFKYLGAWMVSTEKDIKYRKAAAWRACCKLSKIWKSSLPKSLKLRIFTATVESVLLYGCEAWTITAQIAKELDGCFTRLLRTVLNVHWEQRMTNKELYGDLPKLSDKIKERSMRFAGHCSRSVEISSLLIHWVPKHGHRKPGRPKQTFLSALSKELGMEVEELKTAMADRDLWRAITVREHDPD